MQRASLNQFVRLNVRKRGYSLVMVALCLTGLMGIVGLVIDGGLLFVDHRQCQIAADAAARACAQALHSGAAKGSLQGTAETFAYTYNNIPKEAGATSQVIVNNPPSSGPYAGNSNFVEVFVKHALDTTFMRAAGVTQTQHVQARAVAGFKSRARSAGLVVLDPHGNPGVSVSGTGASLNVNPGVIVYSRRTGQDQYGNTVGSDASGKAAVTLSGGSTFTTSNLYVSGGVDNYLNYVAPNVGELHAGTNDPVSDPFHDDSPQLPIPSTGNGVTNLDLGTVTVKNNNPNGLKAPNTYNPSTQVTTLNPGIYHGITIVSGTVIFNPGIYVLSPTSGGGNVLSITGGSVTGSSIMFYNTGDNYTADGSSDTGDLASLSENAPPSLSGVRFGGVALHGDIVSFSGMDSGPFKGMLFYQRRFNTQAISVTNGISNGMKGIVYAKWANLDLSGSGTYDFGIVTGTLSVNGGATVNVSFSLTLKPKIQPVRLVE